MNRYTATAKADNTKTRPDHNTVTDFNPPRYYPQGTAFEGEEIWTATADNKHSSQYVGDKWLKVLTINGASQSGTVWVAIIHQGKPICDLVDHGTPPVDPPVTGNPAAIDMELTSGSVVTVKDASGNVLWTGTA